MASHRVGSLAERLIAMHSFRNDYMEGAHPRVMDALVHTNAEQQIGYTEDPWCMKARTAIRRAIVDSDSKGALRAANIAGASLQVEFVSGGTMANLLCIGAALRPWECVIATPDGHVNVHETGAIEGTGHKVLTTDETVRTLPMAVSGLLSVGDGMIHWNVVMAGNVFLFAPMLIIYLLANRSIKQAFIYGGIK